VAGINELTHACLGGASRKLQCSLGIDGTLDLAGMFLARVMHSGCQMQNGVDTEERFLPIRLRTDSIDDNRIFVGRRLSHGLSDYHTVSRQHRRNIPPDESIHAGYHDKSAIFHFAVIHLHEFKSAPATLWYLAKAAAG
jgi:hypothetical protein